MRAIEIARRLAALGSTAEANNAYMLAIHESAGEDPASDLEAALYILQSGGNYKVAYTCLQDLYQRDFCREECLEIMTRAFYAPNEKELEKRYEKNCKLLQKYPYLFRKDFLPFEELPVRFFPYDENGYLPFDRAERRFGAYVDFNAPVVSRNFFRDLEKPIFASDVYSQYELEYLNDNVRKSEYIGRENHVYLHYSDWSVFCAHLQCLNVRPLLKEKKLVFLIGEEEALYPIDFKERFGIDYSVHPVKPVGIRELNRLIWHTQLATHNGGDLFNEVFDAHPNLVAETSILFDSMEKTVSDIQRTLKQLKSTNEVVKIFTGWDKRLINELYLLKDRSDKDVMAAMFLNHTVLEGAKVGQWLDQSARITPAVFFQPHFRNVLCSIDVDEKGNTTLDSEVYDQLNKSSMIRGFKYIKTFTPLRRVTTSYGGTMKFMYEWAMSHENEMVGDLMSQRMLNRSYMIDWQDRLFKDSILVRFEDAKLNSTATFHALAEFLDLPYTESMTYGSEMGRRIERPGWTGVFDPGAVYRTYDEYMNRSERYFLEYFLRDVYECYGYDFQTYDGAEVDRDRAYELIEDFTTLNDYIRKGEEHWYANKLAKDPPEDMTEDEIKVDVERAIAFRLAKTKFNLQRNAAILLRGLRFVNKNGQQLHMMPQLKLDPALLEQPLYH